MKKGVITAIIVSFLLIPMRKSSAEFLNTLFHLNFGGAYTLVYGEIIDFEHRSGTLVTTPGYVQYAKPTHYESSFTISGDLMPFPPIIFGNDSQAIKFGIRGGYRFHFLKQKLVIKKTSKTNLTFTDDFMNYQSWMIGPVIRYAPSIKPSEMSDGFVALGGITLFALVGKLNEATLTTHAAKKDAITKTTTYMPNLGYTQEQIEAFLIASYNGLRIISTPVDGIKVDVGIGGEISIYFINFGINLYYSRIFLRMKYPVYTIVLPSAYPYKYTGKNTIIDQFNIEAYVSLPIEWSIFPKVQ